MGRGAGFGAGKARAGNAGVVPKRNKETRKKAGKDAHNRAGVCVWSCMWGGGGEQKIHVHKHTIVGARHLQDFQGRDSHKTADITVTV